MHTLYVPVSWHADVPAGWPTKKFITSRSINVLENISSLPRDWLNFHHRTRQSRGFYNSYISKSAGFPLFSPFPCKTQFYSNRVNAVCPQDVSALRLGAGLICFISQYTLRLREALNRTNLENQTLCHVPTSN
jgi:hypothetical protein